MNEEIMANEELEVIDLNEETYDESCGSGSGIGKFALAGIVLAAAGAGIAFVGKKCKGKLEQATVKRLEKKGYVVFKDEEVDHVEEIEVDDDSDVEESDK